MPKIRLIVGFEKIAAGEVIERPASVVKELMENSIDASATQIFIHVEDAGKSMIQIQDNGSGIDAEDVEIAFQRHTSSKISSASELDQLQTLGFRGEALASIAAVSYVELVSRPPTQAYGMRIIIEGGEKKTLEQTGVPVGTLINVRNLFYNLPVRQKFLRDTKVELGYISDIVTRYALAYPGIHFKLEHNRLVLLNNPAWIGGDKSQNTQKKDIPPPLQIPTASDVPDLPLEAYGYTIHMIYGQKVLTEMIKIDSTVNNVRLFGFLGLPSIARSDRKAASLFINHRLVSTSSLAPVMEEIYKDYLMRNKYPFYVLFLEVNPNTVDFNVHPTKKIVKFVDESGINALVTQVLKQALRQVLTTSPPLQSYRKADISPTSQRAYLPQSVGASQSKGSTISGANTHSFPPGSAFSPNSCIPESYQKTTHQTHFQFSPNPASLSQLKDQPFQPFLLDQNRIPVFHLPPLGFLNNGMQAGNTYLVFQDEEGLVIIDQHAAHERINYEKVQREMAHGKIQKQKLLAPFKVDFPTNEVEFVSAALSDLDRYGFELEFFGGTSFIIRALPPFIDLEGLSPLDIADICREIVQLGRSTTIQDKQREILQYLGCHMSIRAGDEIWDKIWIQRLIRELDQCENPQFCAHGRPTYIKISFTELEKMFHRI